MQFRLYSSVELNADKWDEFVSNAEGGSIYSEFGTLNSLCAHWAVAMIEQGDEWVAAMPVQVARKYGIHYSLPPVFTQYLGVLRTKRSNYSDPMIQRRVHELLCVHLPRHFSFFVAHTAPNSLIRSIWEQHGFQIDERISYVLNLHCSEEEIFAACNNNTRRNIRKGQKQYRLGAESKASGVIELFRSVKGSEVKGIGQRQYRNYSELIDHLIILGRASVYTLRDDKGSLRAGVIIMHNGKQAIYSLGAQTEAARKEGLLSALLWHAIVEAKAAGFAEFDFEGSMHPGIAQFFAGFGAVPRVYLKVVRKPFWYRAKL